MIFLPLKDRENPPARLLVGGALRQIERAVINTDGKEYNATYYPDTPIIELLRAYSIHKHHLQPGDKPKCNYCESQLEHGLTLQVEHYRPKAKIEAGINDNVELPGYYWLGLEWTNLLLACPKCNGKDAKGNHFPIRGVRATAINPVLRGPQGQVSLDRSQIKAHTVPLSDELPLLLNPEIDRPENFLTFDLYANIDGHGPHAERGNISKDTYRLNRDLLVVERLDVWMAFKKRIEVDIAGYELGIHNEAGLHYLFKVTCQELLERRSPQMEFTLWGRFINDNIVDFINVYIAVEYQDSFNLAYDEVVAALQLAPV
jgi:hypothetical protein